MDTLKTAYKILYSLEHKKKADYMDVIRSLLDEGYIAGVKIQMDIIGNQMVDIENARITLKGAEYLRENGAMRKFAQIATDVISIVK